MSQLIDGVLFTPASTGTGDFVVSAAVQGYMTPAAAAAVNGAVYSYRAESADQSQWEMGIGTYSSGTPTVSRTTVLFNSAGTTAKISFATIPNVGLVPLSTDLAGLSKANHFTDTTNATAYTAASQIFDGGLGVAKDVIIHGQLIVGGVTGVASAGDIILSRISAPTNGVLFLGNQSGGSRYLYYDGTNYNLQGAAVLAANGRLWGATDFNYALMLVNSRLVYAADYTHGPSFVEPYAGAVMTGFGGVTGSSAVARYRYLQIQVYTGTWYTVAYV